ncbi:GNAT family N-acetyltransferase [Streptomyces sp. NPDC093589]|uniref:GNAT family N-acetyltransferase n=1 Tax=Streptomyces sp. NPDC093589 TaxID=3366043 RepID=UPI0038161962
MGAKAFRRAGRRSKAALPVVIRRAHARDAKRLTRLVRGSSAYEGPFAAMVDGYRVGPDYIEAHRVFVAVEAVEAVEAGAGGDGYGDGYGYGYGYGRADGRDADGGAGGGVVLGFYALVVESAELDLMFVADAAQGRGIGRLLIEHMKGEARSAGLDAVRIVSHPPSEGFYRSVGALRIGTLAAAPPVVMWDRPELTLPVTERADDGTSTG